MKQVDPLFRLRDLGVQTLPPREVGWLQDEIGGQFRDGRTFQDLIDILAPLRGATGGGRRISSMSSLMVETFSQIECTASTIDGCAH